MTTLATASQAIRDLDTVARQNTALHRVDARIKVLTTLAFLIAVLSVDRYTCSALIPFCVYPAIMIRIGRLPAGWLLSQTARCLPLVACIAIWNPLYERTILLHLGPVAVSAGWLSCCSIMLRATLTILAVLVLTTTTGMHPLCGALRRLGLPGMCAQLLLCLYRYLVVLLDETARMSRARLLRAGTKPRMPLTVWASMVGTLLLRTVDRAERIHRAMLARGFDGRMRWVWGRPLRRSDLLFLLGWTLLFATMRTVNLSTVAGRLLHTGGL